MGNSTVENVIQRAKNMSSQEIENAIGAFKGNVYAVSHAANHAKNVVLETQHKKCKMTAKQLLKMCETLCNMGFDDLDK